MKYYFVIDTDTHAGNFEREMCAYITGEIGDCGVGQEVAFLAQEGIPKEILDKFANYLIIQEPDEHGIFRPCKIYPTPNYYNNGYGECFKDDEEKGKKKYPAYLSVAIGFYEQPDSEIIELMKKRAIEFADFSSKRVGKKIGCRMEPGEINVLGFRFIEEKIVVKEIEI